MLKDCRHNEQLNDEGYVILRNIIDKSIIEKLRRFYNKSLKSAKFEHYRAKGVNHVNTAMSSNITYKRKVFEIIKTEIQPVIDLLFHNFKIVIANYIIKYPGGENECKIHQDISLIEEDSEVSSYTIWFTLDDINEKSSPLYAVPHTHNLLKNYVRGVGVTLGLNGFKDNLLPKAKTLVPFNAGDILVMNPRLVHGSLPTPNSHEMRIAIGIGIIPVSKKFILYVKENENVKKYFINEETMLNYNPEKRYEFNEPFEIVSNNFINYEEYKKILYRL